MSRTALSPKKPRPDFPLFAHQNGQWCKKIKGKQFYFGCWAGAESTLEEYLRTKDDLQAGRTPTPRAGVVTLAHICNAYLERAEVLYNAGELSIRSFSDYHNICKLAVSHWGRTVDPGKLRSSDFAGFRDSVSHYSPGRLTKIVTVVRMVMKWAYESEMVDQMPRFGPDFKGVSKRKVRQQTAATGARMIDAAELRTILDALNGKQLTVGGKRMTFAEDPVLRGMVSRLHLSQTARPDRDLEARAELSTMWYRNSRGRPHRLQLDETLSR